MNDRHHMGALLGFLAATACSGTELPGSEGELPDGSGGSGGSANMEPEGPREVADRSATRVVRLSHAQYASTVQELFGIEDSPDGAFAPDALNGFSFNTSNDLRVDPRLGPQYRNAAEELAERAVNDEELFERIVDCDASDAGCKGDFIESFGERAFRRPLTQTESTRFEAIFDAGASLGDSGDEFRDGVQIVVEAMLQAPQFLYRTEVSRGTLEGGRELLDDWEVASRLSYFIYDSMPDEELFSRARQGQLRTPEQVAGQVARMLDDARASDKFVSFHEQVWQFGRYSKISPDADTYPDLPEGFSDRLRDASSRFIESVIGDGGGLRELLTAPYAFADAELAPLYDSNVRGDELQRIEFEDGERKGFMMQAGFLASNAYSVKTDPIHRGLFVLRDMLCREVPDPPPGAQMTPPPEATEPIETTREEITLLTGQLYCPTCHSQINEPGFAFEGFDAIGQTRERENGVLVDTTGSIQLDGESVEFAGASELVEALADSSEARDCYTSRWLEFAYGRPLTDADLSLRDRLAREPESVQEIITRLATSPEFLSRKAVE
jgi:uncharacterized protein DUF1592/uncharacterized protein DUF1588/uncharacterized protein DUF1595/uncharacterized protein DUF1585/uncharacterized protein DUF1587